MTQGGVVVDPVGLVTYCPLFMSRTFDEGELSVRYRAYTYPALEAFAADITHRELLDLASTIIDSPFCVMSSVPTPQRFSGEINGVWRDAITLNLSTMTLEQAERCLRPVAETEQSRQHNDVADPDGVAMAEVLGVAFVDHADRPVDGAPEEEGEVSQPHGYFNITLKKKGIIEMMRPAVFLTTLI
jgi:hypothetical protein